MSQISVIVPVYKVESYIHRCIDSILTQTFDDFELILVDDGSPDNCGKICDEYAKKDSRIKVIHKDNGGLSSARNAGIDWAITKSESEWLCFIDSDDSIHPCFLEYLHRAVIECNVQIGVCDVFQTTENTVEYAPMEFTVECIGSMKFYADNNVWATIACNKFYKKDLFDKVRYPLGKIHEDEFVTYKLLYAVRQIAWVNLPMYIYFRREDSIMGENFLKNTDGLLALKQQLRFFKKRDPEIYNRKLINLRYYYTTLLHYMDTLHDVQKQKGRIRREFARFLILNQKKLKMSVKTHPDRYELAFPNEMCVYWAIKAIIYKIQKDGLLKSLKSFFIKKIRR